MKNEYARPHQKSVLRMHLHTHFLTTFCTQVQNIAAPARVPTLNLLLAPIDFQIFRSLGNLCGSNMLVMQFENSLL